MEKMIPKTREDQGSVLNHFNQERILNSRQNFKANRSAALAEWRDLCTA